MKKIKSFILVLLLFLSIACINNAKNNKKPAGDDNLPDKEVYIPVKVHMVPDSNDYNNDESEYSFSRMIETDNLALFWHKEYGLDPMLNPDTSRRFDVHRASNECERFYDYYVNELKMVKKGNSLTDKYKMLIYVFGGDEGTAFGGGEEDKVGILWTPATRINKQPYGALAHEMAHSFQYISNAENGTGPKGPIIEMSAQYMLWQVYPEWMTFENYHLVDFLKDTHYAFLHPANMYHSPYVLEYWAEKHGKEFFGELSRATQKDEDPVMTYKRIHSLTQEQFNNEMFDASRRFITWDLKRVEKVANKYANRHRTFLIAMKDGWYRVDSANCPQNYGYNGIQLNVPPAGTKVKLNFKGIAGDKSYRNVKTDKAGWRYGFLAHLENGKRVYGDMFYKPDGSATFKVPDDTGYLWLVVMGAPTEHWPVVLKAEIKEEQWPYQVKFEGSGPVGSNIKDRSI